MRTCAKQVPDPNNMYGPKFRFGSYSFHYNPLQYIPDASVRCMDNGKFPL